MSDITRDMTTSKDAPDGTDHNAAQKTSQVSDCDISPSTTTASQNSAIPVSGREKLRLSSADMKAGFGIVAQQEQQQVPGNTSSWSASSDKQLYSSPRSSSDRVFPIRSVVGIDPTQTPYSFQGRSSGEHADYFAPGAMPVPVGRESNNPSRQNTASDAGNPAARVRRQMTEAQTTREAARRERRQSSAADGPQVGGTGLLLFRGTPGDGGSERSGTTTTHTGSAKASESVSIKSDSIGDRTTSTRNSLDANGSAYGLVTARFKHVVTADGHAVITGRDGETLQRCEDEPIHIPGAVQGFGLLVALVEDEQGHLVVRIVSENSARIIGYSPKELFALRSFTDILSEEQQDNLLDHVDFIRDDEADPATNGPEVFTITVRPPSSPRRSRKLWCAMHINPAHPDIIICEFELDDDQLHPLVPPHEKTPEPPEDTLDSNPTAEEYQDSTQNLSKPLRVLRSARKRHGEAAAMEVFNIMSQVQEQLASATNLDQFLKVLVGVVKELTGFHRVMIYQFDSSFNGRVVTELVDPRATKDLYKGLNFPASDIPKQARDLYKVNKVRMLYDRDMQTARLVCRTLADLEDPLDLSYSYLRAMSPIHIKYLANMAVRSSMSISINAFRELWGLIACHSYGSKGMRVSFPIRKMCRLVGDIASRNIERLSYASRLQARKLINTVPTQNNPSGYIIASSEDLLKLFDADFGMLSIRGETKVMGKLDQTQEGLAMLEYLRLRKITSVVTSQDIKLDFPDLRYTLGFEKIAGLLLVPLSVGGSDFIVFFRQGQTKEVKWAGNPYEKFIKEGTEGYLEPRKSFKMWSETVVGKCREWTEEEVETAAVLCLVYGKFIEVWRQKEAALQNSQLTKLLLSNSAHEVRTPLNAIINYLEIALEGALDHETRENLLKSHSASKSLIYVINDLLDLTKTEEGQDLIREEIFDLPATVREAASQFENDARRKGLQYQTNEQPGVPQYVQGDQRRVRQAIANITANAIQHTTRGSITIDLWLVELQASTCTVEISIADTGVGMSDDKLDALFRELEQVSSDGAPGILIETKGSSSGQKDDERALGLGLAVVARIIRNMDGQLRLKSAEGEGSRFVIQLTFSMPTEETVLPKPDERSTSAKSQSVVRTPPVTDGEVTLVRKGSASKHDTIARRHSVEEMASLHSFKSAASSSKSKESVKSDVDRLIDALSGPFLSDDDDERRSVGKNSNQSRKSVTSINSIPADRRLINEAGKNMRSASMSTTMYARNQALSGYENVQDSKTPIKAVKMPDEFDDSDMPMHATPSRVNFSIPEPASPRTLDAENLQVLVAEDDPINSRIIRKRLEKCGHVVRHTANGEDCASSYSENCELFDVVLMDMQMPIVDGLTATKMIRSFERIQSPKKLSKRAAIHGRVPIFAVSASLVERERETYINAGFDGWILKPIDFKRVNTLLGGIVDDKLRAECLYSPSLEWEHGGWFSARQPDNVPMASSSSSQKAEDEKSASLPDPRSEQLKRGSVSSVGSVTPTNEPLQSSNVEEATGEEATGDGKSTT